MARILVIDDDDLVLSSLRIQLEANDHEVITADSGQAGITMVSRNAFDVVICDVFMPDMDGFETIRAIHERDPDVPVIVISGFTFRHTTVPTPDFLAMATQLGAACSLRKPFRPNELLRAVDGCLRDRSPALAAVNG
jgi:DNA-binding NtrC family response regulator